MINVLQVILTRNVEGLGNEGQLKAVPVGAQERGACGASDSFWLRAAICLAPPGAEGCNLLGPPRGCMSGGQYAAVRDTCSGTAGLGGGAVALCRRNW